MARRGGGVATALMIALSLCVFAGGAYALYYVLTADWAPSAQDESVSPLQPKEFSEYDWDELAEVAALREEKLKSAQAEADKILKDAREKAQEEHDRLIESANEDIADIVGSMTEKLVLKASTDEAYEQFLSAAERGEEHEKD